MSPDSTRSGYSWWHFDKVLLKLGWIQQPNHSEGFLTYVNTLGERIIIMKENNMNLDYFHKLLKQLSIPPLLFVKLVTERENTY